MIKLTKRPTIIENATITIKRIGNNNFELISNDIEINLTHFNLYTNSQLDINIPYVLQDRDVLEEIKE